MHWTDAVDGRPLRHARVRLDPATWRASAVDVAAHDVDALVRWIDAGRPLVACRRDPSRGDACRVAVALPDRRRIGFDVDPCAVTQIAPPLRLDAVVDTAPHAWRDALRDLVDRGRRIEARFHVYGSLAWQAIGADRYVGPASDVDLLWPAASMAEVDRVVASLRVWEAATGLRADGEVLLPDGGGVAWRELASRPGRVLVKRVDRVSLEPLDRCFEGVAA